jgi:hypothetical protein
MATEGATVPRLAGFLEALSTAQATGARYTWQNDQLLNHWETRYPFRMATWLLSHIASGRHRLVVPTHHAILREIMLYSRHGAPFAGQIGVYTTFAHVRARFRWPGMADDGQEYLRTCHQCQPATKVERQPRRDEVHPHRLPIRR